jgi:hypothetical protein
MQASQVAQSNEARSSYGRRFSMLLSLMAAVAIWYFFMAMRGWKPVSGLESEISSYVTWGLLIYLGVQLTMLIWTSTGGTRREVWLDTMTSLVPFVLVIYVLVDHWRHLEELPLEQLRLAKSTALTAGIDFMADLGVAIATQRRWWLVLKPADRKQVDQLL